MARHRQTYRGERLSAQMQVQLKPSDRAALVAAAAEQGITLSAFCRELTRNGLRAYRIGGGQRAAHRQKIVAAVDQLTAIGIRLNELARRANEVKRIEDEDAVLAVCRELVDLFNVVPPRMTEAPCNPETKRLVAVVASVEKTVQQLKKLAATRLHMRSKIALKGVEAATNRIDQALGCVDTELKDALHRVLPS